MVGGREGELTMMAWMNELKNTKIQMGTDMYRMPAHMHIMAPAW